MAYALETIIGKLVAKHSIANPWVFNFVWNFFIVLFILPLALYFGAGLPAHLGNIFWASLFYALAGVFFILALYKLDISVLTPLYSVKTAIAVLLAALFLGEILTGGQYTLIGLILIFSVFVSLDENWSLKSFLTPGIGFALADMMALALLAVFIKKAIAENGFWDTTLWVALLGQVWLVFTIPLLKKDLPTTKLQQYGATMLMAVAGVVGTLAANKAYAQNVSISTAITSLPLSMLLIFVLSFFAPKLLEKHTLTVYAVRFVSAAIMIAAALKLG